MVYVIEVYFQESIVYHKYEKALKNNSKIWNDYILAVDESDRNIVRE